MRLVSLSPHLTENLFVIGAGGQLLGVSRYSDYPEAAQALPVVGDYQSLNIEAILALQPDLILAWADGGNIPAIEQLQRFGIAVYWSRPTTLASIADELRTLGGLTAHADEAERQAKQFETTLQSLTLYSQLRPVSVFYQVWQTPLQTLNHNTLINSVIELCGGVNIYAQLPATVAQVAVESLLAQNPEMILGSHPSGEQPHWRSYWQRWPQLHAVQAQHIFSINADYLSRHTPRILFGAEQVCQAIDSVRSAT
ncbi:cobalamin-binding protein [Halioxenophilus sp. WMMB6]|uniref:cobalamin-binding protein n=1 Tax=Halioxenophilus sp. WMMB6 TaxID=3073815 RepID=UPI00295EAA18|nr:cobalamin-binding protein [Halioxenophilus sp. WMMB6]